MRLRSLSMRLGLSVSMMGAALVVLLAALAYFALTRELDNLSEESLEDKLKQIQHTLSADMDSFEISGRPHALLDTVVGHDNLHLTILDEDADSQVLFSVGKNSLDPALKNLLKGAETKLFRWSNSEGHNILTASRLMSLQDGDQVRIVLSIDRMDDEVLLSAYLRSTLATVPFLLALIGIGAWWIVRRGLSPLRHIRRVASLVSTQDLSPRISVDKLPEELSELAHGINFMLHRLDSGVQQLSQFSDDLAHELRSPITNLMGKAQVTLSRDRPPEEYKAVLESCTEELERVTRIVSDMLFLAQVSHPTSLITFEKISLGDEAIRVADLFALTAEEKKIELKVSGNGGTYGDRLMIQRAISNLLSNAIRHSPIGAIISIQIQKSAETISISVENPGIGIPSQHLPYLFERFYRVDKSRSRAEGGTGLGLAIVRSIMSLHQGTVEVSSTPGGPTTFRLNFPKVDSPL
ncbi:heavy metal sensor histidine kinase [Metapseudomonas furukawaii]|uniref:heavy metal sensor histidine kinase n=1 Tax=Metapseudomonas furukawaii TaxID=1149133 RepID=UPI00227A2E1F|nr:heavy metal sensor histidine kinase [Pseudomonas furukawaii]WAG78881.1 heavy metal sensor histidine kinase [Pseudomonas furukawaii]